MKRSILADEIVDSITMFEHRVDVTNNDIKMEQVDNKLSIHITYHLKNSNVNGNTDILMPIPTPKEV